MPQVELTAMVDQLVNLKQQLQSLNTVAGNFKKQLQDVGNQGYKQLTTESQLLNNKLRKELSILQQLIILRQKAKKGYNTAEDIRQLKAIEKKVKEINKERIAVKKLDTELKKNASVNKQVASTNNRAAASQNRVTKSTQKSNMMFRQLRGVMLSTFGAYAVIRGIKNTINIIKDFELAMAKVRAITGATSKEIDILSRSAISLSSGSIFDAKTIATLQVQLAKLGFSVQEIANSTEGVLKLATAAGEELAPAAALLASTLRGFNLEAIETERVANIMGKAFTTSALDLARFKESIKYIAPIAYNLGITVDETASLLGKLADQQIYGSLAGTGLRNIMIAMSDTSGKLAARVGFAVRNFDDLVKALRILSTEGVTLSDVLQLVDKRASSAFLGLLENVDALEEYQKELKNSSSAIDEMANIQLETLSGKLDIATNKWKSFVLEIDKGDGVISKSLKFVADSFGDFFLRAGGNFKEFYLFEDLKEGFDLQSENKSLEETLRLLEQLGSSKMSKNIVGGEEFTTLIDYKPFLDWQKKIYSEIYNEMYKVGGLLDEIKDTEEEYFKGGLSLEDARKKSIKEYLDLHKGLLVEYELEQEGINKNTALIDTAGVKRKAQLKFQIKSEELRVKNAEKALNVWSKSEISINKVQEKIDQLTEAQRALSIVAEEKGLPTLTKEGQKAYDIIQKDIDKYQEFLKLLKKDTGVDKKIKEAYDLLKEEVKSNKKLLKAKYELAEAELELIKDTKEKETKLSELGLKYKNDVLLQEVRLVKGNATEIEAIGVEKEKNYQEHLNNLLEINGNSIDAVIEVEKLKNDKLKSEGEKVFAEKKAQWEKDGDTEVEIRRKTAIEKAKLDQEMLEAEVAVAQMELRLRSNGTNATAEEIEQLKLKVDDLIIQLEAAGVKVKMLEKRPSELAGWDKLVDDLKNNAEKFAPVMGSIVDAYGSIADAAVDKSERIVDALNTQVSEQQNALEIEMRLSAQGLANNVNVRKKELEDAKKARDQSLKDREKALKRQEYIESVSQSINLASTASILLKDYVGKIPVVGLVLGIIAIATLLQAFKGFKSDASALTKYEKGGWEVLQGNSHQNGGISLGGNREAQGGEMVSIFNRSATKKHQPLIADLTNAINKDKLDVFLNQGAFEKVNDSNINVSQSVNLDDSKQINKMNVLLSKNLKQRNIRFEGNKRIEKFGSRTRIIITN